MRFLFVDRIVEMSPGEHIRGIKHITRDDAYLCADEQGLACFMPSLIGETLGQLAAWNVMYHNQFRLRPVAGLCASAELHRPAYVGETLLLESFIEKLDEQAVQYNSIAHVNHEPVFSLKGALGPLLAMDEFINPKAVRQQFAEVYRPGSWEEILLASKNQSIQDVDVPAPSFKTVMTFDRILDIQAGLSISAEKRISRSSPYFDDHFPNKPVLPLTVLLECKINLAKSFLKQSDFKQNYHFRELRKIKMSGFVQPGDIIVTQAKVKSHSDSELILSFNSRVDDKRVCVAEAVFTAKD